MSVKAAVERDLKKMPADVRASGLAATALAMAAEIDSIDNSATSKSMCAGKLIDAMDKLRAAVPDVPQRTKLDEIAEARERRLARQSGS